MKFFYIVFLSIFLSANVMAEDTFSNNPDKQNCSQDKSFVENSSVFIPNTQYMIAGSCGFKPFRPFGCSNGRAVCYCDSTGNNCEWIWVGCG